MASYFGAMVLALVAGLCLVVGLEHDMPCLFGSALVAAVGALRI